MIFVRLVMRFGGSEIDEFSFDEIGCLLDVLATWIVFTSAEYRSRPSEPKTTIAMINLIA